MTGKKPIEDNPLLSFRAVVFSILLILSLLLCSYFNAFTPPFTLDDNHQILENKQIRDVTDLKSIHDCAPSRPLLMLSYAVNYHLGELHPFGYHLGNVLIHALVSILVFIAATYLFVFFGKGLRPPALVFALVASFFFVLQPIFTEPTTYVSARSSSQSAFFYLLAFIFFIKTIRQGHHLQNKIPKILFCISSLFFYLLSIATKEIGATLPLVLTLFCLLLPKGQKARSIFITLPFYLLLAALFLLRWTRAGVILEKDPGFLVGNTRLDYLLTQLQVVPFYYLNKLFLPIDLNIDIDFPVVKELATWGAAGSMAILFLGVLFCLRWTKKSVIPLFGLGWFVLALLPTSSIIPIMDVAVERRVYLPGAGFAFLFSFFWVYAIPQGKKIFPFVLCILSLLGLFGVETIKRNHLFGDEFMLWKDVLEKSPFKARSHYAMGYLYENQKEIDLSILEFRKALELSPGYADAWYGLGLAYFRKGIFEKSRAAYGKAIFLRKDKQAKYYSGYGTALQETGKFEEAEDAYMEAVRIDPDHPQAKFNLANLYAKTKRYKEAEVLYLQLLREKPGYKPALRDLCGLYILSGRYEDSKKAIEEGLKRYPDDPKLEELRRAVDALSFSR